MSDPTVEVNQGKLRGVNGKNINGINYVAFRGIPYAKPPVGNLRFKDSEPAEPWSGVRDAFNFGGRCAQKDWISHRIIGSDDCLYLNVYTSAMNPSVPKAVMVWIHGGGFYFGSGDDDFYGPDYLIEEDIVLVTINYRLGMLGFLNVDNREAPGNQGLKDQVLALKWINQNIAKFGGDSHNITIFGESAGGASVHYLSISPLAQGLFHKAIMQSGVAFNPWASSSKSPMESVKKLATSLDKNISNVNEFVEYLRTLDAHTLVEIEAKIRSAQDEILFIHPFVPSVDSKADNPFLIKPIEEMAKGGIKVPCMCGYLSHEGIIIAAAMNNDIFNKIDEDPENLLINPVTLRFLKQHNVTINDVKRFYLSDKHVSSDNIENIIDLHSDMHFIVGLHHFVDIQSKISKTPTYLYKFEYEVENSYIKNFLNMGTLKGTCHGEELNYIFYPMITKLVGKPPASFNSIEYYLIQRFTKMWTNFAKIGNPTPQKTDLIPVEWKPIDNSIEYKCLEITDKLNMGTVKNITRQLMEIKNDKL